MSEWKETTLSNIANIVAGYAFKGSHFGEKGAKVIKIKDISPPYIDIENAKKVDINHYNTHKLEKYLRLFSRSLVIRKLE